MPQPLTITLSPDLAEKIRVQAASHGYTSEREYVEDHLAEAIESDLHLDGWLNTIGVARYDAYDANPKDVLTGAQLRSILAQRRQERSKAG